MHICTHACAHMHIHTHTHMYAYMHTLVPPFFPAEFRVLILESTCFNNFYGKFKGTLHRMNIYDSCHTSPLYECRYRENCSGPSLQITCEVCVCVHVCVCVFVHLFFSPWKQVFSLFPSQMTPTCRTERCFANGFT